MESKRRRIENDLSNGHGVGSSSSRGPVKAPARAGQDSQHSRLANPSQAQKDPNQPYYPLLDLATLPPAALQRYLSRYQLIEPHGTLSYHHAVFPTPPLPAELVPPMNGRQLLPRRPKPHSYDDPSDPGELDRRSGVRGKKRAWMEPKTAEFAEVTAYDGPGVVVDRLADKCRAHWDKKETVKEGETLTNFMFALRMRAHTLRATPPG